MLQLLKNRLLLVDLLGRHPEIPEIELVPPVVIAGLPRTGTTHLHNLLAAGPTFRSLPYWESVEPFPLPAEAGVDPEPRIARTDQAVWFMNAAMPHFPLMHEMTTDHVHEEIQLLANDFSTMFFETIAEVPAWRDHYLAHDQTPHYAHLRLQLKALQHLRGGRRWLLKSPQHLEQLPVLARSSPGDRRGHPPRPGRGDGLDGDDGRLHRADAPVAGAGRGDRPLLVRPDRHDARRAGARPRRARPGDARSTSGSTSSWPTTWRWPSGSTSWPASRSRPPTRAAMAEYLAGHQRGRLGRIDYRRADLGLDADELRARFAPYTERFLEDQR